LYIRKAIKQIKNRKEIQFMLILFIDQRLKSSDKGNTMDNSEQTIHKQENTSFARIEPYTQPAGGWGRC
jgi:hypothetical protein